MIERAQRQRNARRPRPAPRRPVAGLLAVLAVAALVGTGCSKVVAGGGGIPAAWNSGPAHDVLAAIPADAHTRTEIYLANPLVLAQVMAAVSASSTGSTGSTGSSGPSGTSAASTSTSSASSTRSGSAAQEEYRQLFTWINAAQLVPDCLVNREQSYVSDRGADARPSAVPSTVVSVAFSNKFEPGEYLSLCVGPRQPAEPYATNQTTASSPSTIAGVAGRPDGGSGDNWVGFRGSDEHRFAFGSLVPESARTAVISNTPVASSLADDPDVRAVLAVAGPSPSVFLGTELLAFPSGTSSTSIKPAADKTGRTWPRAHFAAFAWRPISGGLGTAQFITIYDSEAAANDAAVVLNQVWVTSTDPRFSTAISQSEGLTTVTTVKAVTPRQFNLATLSLLRYPGYYLPS